MLVDVSVVIFFMYKLTVDFIKLSSFCTVVKMFTSRKKIHKDKDVEPTEFEETVGQVLF